jgi:D-ribose pyranose/furanose isomerase RbsD
LQINLLAEKEITKVLQLLQRMSREMHIEESVTDQEIRELSKDTEVKDVARDLQENLTE